MKHSDIGEKSRAAAAFIVARIGGTNKTWGLIARVIARTVRSALKEGGKP